MNEKLLIINDDDMIREMVHLALTPLGFKVFEAPEGITGLELSTTITPDLILLDIIMPYMDGYAVCKELKSNPKTKEIPVIFLSSLISPQEKIKGLELGAVDFINYTVDHKELAARVETHLKISALQKELKTFNEQLKEKQKKLEDDLSAAAIIQRSVLPPANLTVPHLHFAWVSLPCGHIGGDLLNIIPLGNEHVALYILDVSGHDVPSALVTISVSQYFHQHAMFFNSLSSPKNIIAALNKEYPIERFERYFTIFYAILNTQTGYLSYSSAGHPPSLLLQQNERFKLLNCGGTIIGFNNELPTEEGRENLKKGDKLVFYTDGIIELKNIDNAVYGFDRFCDLLESIKEKPVDVIVDTVMQSIKEFNPTPQDDISLMCIEWI